MGTARKRGGQPGNVNGGKNKAWEAALRRYAAQDGEALNKAAKALFDKAIAGDVAAAKEIGDRLDGKSVQPTTVGGDPDNPIVHQVNYRVVSPQR